MDSYHIALFVHLIALLVAAGVTAVTKLAATRRARARTVGEVLEWHNLLTSASKLFPLCLAAFVITGAFMLGFGRTSVWLSGFVVAGLTGAALLLASGTYLGVKGAALKQMLEQMAAKGADLRAPKLVPPPFLAALPLINTGLSLGVVFDMATKPPSIGVALGVLAAGMVLGAAVGLRRPATAGGAVTAAEV